MARAKTSAIGSTCSIIAAGIDAALRKGRDGEVYNFGGHQEIKNIDLTLTLLELLGEAAIADRIRQGPAGARPALRHRLQQGRARAGLEAAGRFSQGNSETIDWYLGNAEWVRRVRSGDYLKYYEEQYGKGRRKDSE